MRIAFYSDTWLPTRDGVVTAIGNFRKELEKRGHEVYIFTAGTRKMKRENKDQRVFFHFSTPFRPYPQYKIALFPFLSQKTVRKLDVDLIHSHTMMSMGIAADRAAHELKVPYVGTLHTMITDATHYLVKYNALQGFAESVAWRYLRWHYNRCDVATTPSNAVKELMVDNKIRNVKVIPNGIDLERFRPSQGGGAIRKRHELEGRHVVMHAGRLVLEKNFRLVIKASVLALEEDPDLRFLAVGAGPALETYKNEVRKNHLEKFFVFTGFVEDAELADYYAAADIFVSASTFETQGLTTLEAMACGKPVAGADYLATKELVSDGRNGYKFNPFDAEDCARAIVRTMGERRRMASGARETAEEFSISACTDRLERLYKGMIR